MYTAGVVEVGANDEDVLQVVGLEPDLDGERWWHQSLWRRLAQARERMARWQVGQVGQVGQVAKWAGLPLGPWEGRAAPSRHRRHRSPTRALPTQALPRLAPDPAAPVG